MRVRAYEEMLANRAAGSQPSSASAAARPSTHQLVPTRAERAAQQVQAAQQAQTLERAASSRPSSVASGAGVRGASLGGSSSRPSTTAPRSRATGPPSTLVAKMKNHELMAKMIAHGYTADPKIRRSLDMTVVSQPPSRQAIIAASAAADFDVRVPRHHAMATTSSGVRERPLSQHSSARPERSRPGYLRIPQHGSAS